VIVVVVVVVVVVCSSSGGGGGPKGHVLGYDVTCRGEILLCCAADAPLLPNDADYRSGGGSSSSSYSYRRKRRSRATASQTTIEYNV